jgi:polysaccharide export outer membrane protein
LISALFILSCVPKRKLSYLHDQKQKELVNTYMNIRPEKTVQPFDNVYIKVSSIDERTANIFESQNRAIGGPNIDLISYTVDQSGYINFPFVGEIYIKDLTLGQAQTRIEEEVSQYLSNISIIVKFVNNRVAVLGEVRMPGEYPFYRDQITIFQALSYASGFADYGDKENVMLIRESSNKVNYHYLDLTDKDIVSSEFYYIIPNDIIVVKAVNAKYRNLSLVNWPIFLTTITTAVTLYLIFAPRNN